MSNSYFVLSEFISVASDSFGDKPIFTESLPILMRMPCVYGIQLYGSLSKGKAARIAFAQALSIDETPEDLTR